MLTRTCRLVISVIVLALALGAAADGAAAWPDAAKAMAAVADASAHTSINEPCATDEPVTGKAASGVCHAVCAGGAPALVPASLILAAPVCKVIHVERGDILDGRGQRPDPAPPRLAA